MHQPLTPAATETMRMRKPGTPVCSHPSQPSSYVRSCATARTSLCRTSSAQELVDPSSPSALAQVWCSWCKNRCDFTRVSASLGSFERDHYRCSLAATNLPSPRLNLSTLRAARGPRPCRGAAQSSGYAKTSPSARAVATLPFPVSRVDRVLLDRCATCGRLGVKCIVCYDSLAQLWGPEHGNRADSFCVW